jgi:tRNA(fMet)-specific endonuclease VapC
VNYLLDTNVCIALINGKPEVVRTRLERAMKKGGRAFVPSIVAFELWYGVGKSGRRDENAERLDGFFSGPATILPFSDDDARAAGTLRAVLEAAGKPIGAYDVLIAGQALNQRLTLVTANVSEFARVKGLVWQDWAA